VTGSDVGGGSRALGAPASVFAYGTLLFPEVMTLVIGRNPPSRAATVSGYARFVIRGESFPGMLAEPASRTRGLLFDGLRSDELARLDAYEGALYVRRSLSVTLVEGATTNALVYLIRNQFRSEVSERPWDPEHFAAESLQSFVASLRSGST
jgi:gamma-glutamylcyclotransferase (GGCT)/AIG2-like uncharacterized protein YtfP